MNKKLLKSITCIGFGVGVASSIPFVSSCKSNDSEMTTTINYSDGASKNLGIIDNNGGSNQSSGVFSIENPNFLKEWSFIVFKRDFNTGEYKEFKDWNSVMDIKINDENKLQVTSKNTGGLRFKINVSATLKNDSKTNSIDGFEVQIHC